jgi:hypothetical protein
VPLGVVEESRNARHNESGFGVSKLHVRNRSELRRGERAEGEKIIFKHILMDEPTIGERIYAREEED